MKWVKRGFWDYIPVRKCMGFQHKIAKRMKKTGLAVRKSSMQQINRNYDEVFDPRKRKVR